MWRAPPRAASHVRVRMHCRYWINWTHPAAARWWEDRFVGRQSATRRRRTPQMPTRAQSRARMLGGVWCACARCRWAARCTTRRWMASTRTARAASRRSRTAPRPRPYRRRRFARSSGCCTRPPRGASGSTRTHACASPPPMHVRIHHASPRAHPSCVDSCAYTGMCMGLRGCMQVGVVVDGARGRAPWRGVLREHDGFAPPSESRRGRPDRACRYPRASRHHAPIACE